MLPASGIELNLTTTTICVYLNQQQQKNILKKYGSNTDYKRILCEIQQTSK